MQKIIEDSSLYLRVLEYNDLENLHSKIFAHPMVMQYSLTGTTNKRYTKNFIKQQIALQKKYNLSCWAIINKENNSLIGITGIMPQIINKIQEFELGFRISYGYWKQGLGTNAAQLALSHTLEKLKLKRLISIIEQDNTAAIKIVKKLGFSFEQTCNNWTNFPVQIYKIKH